MVAVLWWIAMAVLVTLFLLWVDRRTRGRGNKDSSGGADVPFGTYI